MVWSLLLLASIHSCSVAEIARIEKHGNVPVPTVKTVWNNIKTHDLDVLSEKFHETLVTPPDGCSKKARRRLKRCKILALDWTDKSFYGDKKTIGTIGGPKKAST